MMNVDLKKHVSTGERRELELRGTGIYIYIYGKMNWEIHQIIDFLSFVVILSYMGVGSV